MDIKTTMLPMMDPIVSNNRVRIRPDLNSSERVPIDVVVFDHTAPVTEYVDTALVTVVDLVPTDGWVGVRRDPNPSVRVGMDFVFNELTEPVFVDVNAACLPVVDFAADDKRVRACFHFKSCDSVVVDVVRLEVTLKNTIQS